MTDYPPGSMKQLSRHAVFLFCILSLFRAQIVLGVAGEPSCDFDRKHNRLQEIDPDYRDRILANESRLQQDLRRRQPLADQPPAIYTIPLVVHVVHLGEDIGNGSNISTTQIHSAIQALNEDYRKIAGSNGDGNGVDVGFEFCLALRDPYNQPSNGIVRVDGRSVNLYEQQGIVDLNEEAVKDLSRWPNSDYYNIWLVSEINDNDGGSGTQGYAYLPGTGPALDGAVIQHNAFGTTGNVKAGTDLNRTTTHELGHAFDLYHPFTGNSCIEVDTDEDSVIDCTTDGDKCCDTPPTAQQSLCEAPACETTQVENYMDYTEQFCQNMFTADQRDRMRMTITTLRADLFDSNACVAVTRPDSDFTAPSPTCSGPVPFLDLSTDGPTSWQWSFPGGTPDASTAQNPEITYAAGTYTVSLTATNTIGTGDTEIKEDFLNVFPPPAVTCEPSTVILADGYYTGIHNLTFNTINNSSGDAYQDSQSTSDGGYVDFSCSKVTELAPGDEYSLAVEVGSYNAEFVKVYIDYNGDGSFNDTDELAFSSATKATGVHSGTITTPDIVLTDTILRMRVISDSWPIETPCSPPQYGQVEDYGVIFAAAGPPLTDFRTESTKVCPGSVQFEDRSIGGSSTWQWSFPGGNPASSTAQNPTVYYSEPGTYDVTLTATNGAGTGTTETKTSYLQAFAPPPAPCPAETTDITNAYGVGIYRFTLNTIDHASGGAVDDGGYQDYSCIQKTVLRPATAYPVTVQTGPANNEDVLIFIDYNNDGLFDPVTELTFSSEVSSEAIEPEHSGTLITPSAVTGDALLRMRVISDIHYNTTTACGNPEFGPEYGQAQDYGIIFSHSLAGDADLNGVIDLTDALLLLKTMAALPTTPPAAAKIDLDGDGAVGMTEAIYILQRIAEAR